MAKEVILSERPVDVSSFSMAPEFSRPSIGNYKGVMLCNRPLDADAKKERSGPAPFLSAVTAKEQIGLPVTRRFFPSCQKKSDPNSALSRHKKWLHDLQAQKEEYRKQQEEQMKIQEERKAKAKAAREKRRKELEKMPAWALTEREHEELEDAEASELLDFAEGLDFDRYINDFEVKQALEIVKERVDELDKTKDEKWKEDITKEWNQEESAEPVEGNEDGVRVVGLTEKRLRERDGIRDDLSEAGKSLLDEDGRTNKTTMSALQRREERRQKQLASMTDLEQAEAGWDNTLKKQAAPLDKDSIVVADKLLSSSHILRSVHSKASMAQLVEQTKKTKALMQEKPTNPLIVTYNDHQKKLIKQINPSQLPYLHRNPAI
eukprot:GILI01009789.1.p1 GENE.GILI01009789.1~~GILI01009789.1.p1  ORF type:complete len:377 (-),score=75.27 GILI01009789.1:36-1166(-)